MLREALHCTHGDGDSDTDGIDDSIEHLHRATRTNSRDRFADSTSDRTWRRGHRRQTANETSFDVLTQVSVAACRLWPFNASTSSIQYTV